MPDYPAEHIPSVVAELRKQAEILAHTRQMSAEFADQSPDFETKAEFYRRAADGDRHGTYLRLRADELERQMEVSSGKPSD